MHLSASECIRTRPNLSERIRTRRNRSQRVRKLRKAGEGIEHVANNSKQSREKSRKNGKHVRENVHKNFWRTAVLEGNTLRVPSLCFCCVEATPVALDSDLLWQCKGNDGDGDGDDGADDGDGGPSTKAVCRTRQSVEQGSLSNKAVCRTRWSVEEGSLSKKQGTPLCCRTGSLSNMSVCRPRQSSKKWHVPMLSNRQSNKAVCRARQSVDEGGLLNKVVEQG